MRWNEKKRTRRTSGSLRHPNGRWRAAARGPAAATRHRYDAGAVLRRMLPRSVAVGLAAASLFVGGVVLAGALLRHHDPPHPTRHATGAGVPTTTGRTGP
jgi:hypothetical protein